MNLSIAQANPKIIDWQVKIKGFAKIQKARLRKIFPTMNCSNQVKLSFLKGLKQTLKIKLKKVIQQKEVLESQFLRPKAYENEFKLFSEKDYLIISGRCLNQLDQHQIDTLKRLQVLISLKESTKNKKKAQLKSQYMKKSNNQIFQGFYIPEAKMTSSVLIGSQANNRMNQSSISGTHKETKTNMKKSERQKSKMQISQIYQTQICSVLEPILQEARQIYRKNKLLINTLKEDHKKQLELNLWLKQIKLAVISDQSIKKIKNEQKKEKQREGPASIEKNQSETTGSPDEKEKNVSDLKVPMQNSDSKKFQCQPRKNLLEEEKAFSISMENDRQVIKSKESENKQGFKQDELSPKQGRKTSQKINRPSGYCKNKSLGINGNEQMYQQSKSSYLANNKIVSATDFKVGQEPTKSQVEEKIKMSRILLNYSLQKSNLISNKEPNQQQPLNEVRSSLKVNNISNSKQSAEFTNSIRNKNIISDVKNVIHEEDEHQFSSNNSSSSDNQIFQQFIDNQSPHQLKSQDQQTSNILTCRDTRQQVFLDQNLNYNIYVKNNLKNEDQKKSISSKKIQNHQQLFKQSQFKKQPNIFMSQKSLALKNSQIFLNNQNKQNNFLALNTNSPMNFKQNIQQEDSSRKVVQQSKSNPFFFPLDQIINQQNDNQNLKNPLDLFGSAKKSNQNLINQSSQNIFKHQQTDKLTRKNNIFQKNTSEQNPFASKNKDTLLNQAQNTLINQFVSAKPANIFKSIKPTTNSSVFQNINVQEQPSINSLNIFTPSQKRNGVNKKSNPGLNMFGFTKGLKKQSEYSDEQPSEQYEEMRKAQKKEFYFY